MVVICTRFVLIEVMLIMASAMRQSTVERADLGTLRLKEMQSSSCPVQNQTLAQAMGAEECKLDKQGAVLVKCPNGSDCFVIEKKVSNLVKKVADSMLTAKEASSSLVERGGRSVGAVPWPFRWGGSKRSKARESCKEKKAQCKEVECKENEVSTVMEDEDGCEGCPVCEMDEMSLLEVKDPDHACPTVRCQNPQDYVCPDGTHKEQRVTVDGCRMCYHCVSDLPEPTSCQEGHVSTFKDESEAVWVSLADCSSEANSYCQCAATTAKPDWQSVLLSRHTD